MSYPFREPYLTYDQLVETAHYNAVEELPALESAIGGPGERLWLLGSKVQRLWHKGKGKRARWTLETEPALRSAEWMTEKLSRTVLARLLAPGRSREYALDAGAVERDLAVLAELDKVWLAGARDAPHLWHVMLDEQRRDPAVVDAQIRERIARAKAELAWARALRARNLVENYGTPTDVAAVLECDLDEARHLMGAHERFLAWIRAGAAHSRETIPVHRPSGDTGMPDDHAAQLMTAACESETVVPGRPYPHPLPPDLAPWHVYIEAAGHCIAFAVDEFDPDQDPREYMLVAPVRMVLDQGWTIRDGVVVVPFAYSTAGYRPVLEEWADSCEEY